MGKTAASKVDSILTGYVKRTGAKVTAISDALPDVVGLKKAGDFIEGVFAGTELTSVDGKPRILGIFIGPGGFSGMFRKMRVEGIGIGAGEIQKVWLGAQAAKKLEKIDPAAAEFVTMTRDGQVTELKGGRTLESYTIEVHAT